VTPIPTERHRNLFATGIICLRDCPGIPMEQEY
jgi:hypothetical protein